MRRALGFLCIAVLAGCGGGGDRLTKAEFSKQGEKICREGAAETKKVIEKEATSEEVRKMDPQKAQLHLASKAMPVMEKSLSRIEDLKAPEDYEPHVEKLTSGVREVMDLFDEIKDKPQDAEAGEYATRLQKLQKQTRSAASAAGLEACLPENTA